MAKSAIIADDEASWREGLAEFLQHAVPDAEIDQVSDGESLVERVREGQYSLVLTDYNMGEGRMSGTDAITRIRGFDKQMPIYMVSSSSKREEALSAGATGYISKIDEIEARIVQIAREHLK